MSVFLRWGIFGILAFAALLYAYNASKDLAKRRPPPVATVAPAESTQPAESAQPAEVAPVSPDCEVEIAVAQRAIAARDAGDPLDRALRMREIVFAADETQRERLSGVAKRWFGHTGPIGPYSIRRDAAAECGQPTAVTQP